MMKVSLVNAICRTWLCVRCNKAGGLKCLQVWELEWRTERRETHIFERTIALCVTDRGESGSPWRLAKPSSFLSSFLSFPLWLLLAHRKKRWHTTWSITAGLPQCQTSQNTYWHVPSKKKRISESFGAWFCVSFHFCQDFDEWNKPKSARHLACRHSSSPCMRKNMFFHFPSLPTAVKNQVTGNFILNAKSEEAESKTFIENGLLWEYSIDGEKENLKTVGPLHEGIVVLVSGASSWVWTSVVEFDLLFLIWIVLHCYDKASSLPCIGNPPGGGF